jgi:hypothetical protein
MPVLRYKHELGSLVVLKVARSEEHAKPGMATGVSTRSPGGVPLYTVSWEDASDSLHFEYELAAYAEDEDWRASLNIKAGGD